MAANRSSTSDRLPDLARGSSALVLPGVTATATGLVFARGLSLGEWREVGARLGQVEGALAWYIGDWLNAGEGSGYITRERYDEAETLTGLNGVTLRLRSWVARSYESYRRRYDLSWSHHADLASLAEAEQDVWLDDAAENHWSQKELREQLRGRRQLTPPLPDSTYHCIVVDPPWPVEKIVREARPKQSAALDYPTMTLEAIAALDIASLAADGCHLYLWVTHKFLPDAFTILEGWGAAYECQMTWVKNVGFTPFSWMYDTEHVLFARFGSLDVQQKGQRLSFAAPVTRHSAKPDIFYERVTAASPEPRLEMFARQPHKGFTAWGAEAA